MPNRNNNPRRHPVRRVVLCVLLVCVIAAAVLFGLLASKVKKLRQGAAFDFSYSVTSTSSETPVLYSVLEKANATQGSVSGVYAPGKLLLTLRQQNASSPFTHVYISSTETLYDVGQLYKTARAAIVNAYSVASLVLPENWTLGNYISQTQLATLLGVELGKVEMQDMANFTLALGALRRAEPAGALDGYTYFRLQEQDASLNSPELIIGVPLREILSGSIPLHIILTIPQHSAKVELTGTLHAANSTIITPTSRMSDEDIATFAQLRQTVEELLQYVQQLAG